MSAPKFWCLAPCTESWCTRGFAWGSSKGIPFPAPVHPHPKRVPMYLAVCRSSMASSPCPCAPTRLARLCIRPCARVSMTSSPCPCAPTPQARARVPGRVQEFHDIIPLPMYTHTTCAPLNLATLLPSWTNPTDLGPKTYIAYGQVGVDRESPTDLGPKTHVAHGQVGVDREAAGGRDLGALGAGFCVEGGATRSLTR